MNEYLYSGDEVTEILQRAFEAVERAGLPPSLRTLGFDKAVNLCAQKTVWRTVPGVMLDPRKLQG